MQNLPVNNNIRSHCTWPIVLLSDADNRLINDFTRLNTKVSRRLLNVYRRLMEDINIDNQEDMEFFSIAPMEELRI